MQAMETEVKIRVADREALEEKLPGLGFERVTARTLERNALYDTPERTLRKSRQILRIRQYGLVFREFQGSRQSLNIRLRGGRGGLTDG